MSPRRNMRGVFDVRANRDRKGGDRKHMFADPARNLIVVIFGELCGTFMFLLMSYIGTQAALDANTPGETGNPLLPFSLLYIAASFGSALAVNVWVFYRVTGGMFNPAVSLLGTVFFEIRRLLN
jgi:aquaporin related protein